VVGALILAGRLFYWQVLRHSELQDIGQRWQLVDTSIPAGHLTKMVVNDGTWKLFNLIAENERRQLQKSEHGFITGTSD